MKKVNKGMRRTHIKQIKQKVKIKYKKEVSWAVLITTLFWVSFFLGLNF